MFEKKYVFTVPNAITLAGLVITIFGAIHINTVPGIVITAFGRIMDIVDGRIARRFGQSSPFGAMLDAISDKVGGLAIVIAEWYFGIAPVVVLLSFIILNLANAVTGFIITQVEGVLTVPPSKSGKHAIFMQNLSLGAFAVAYVLTDGPIKDVFWVLGVVIAFIGVFLLGLPATIGYYKTAYSLRKH